MNDDELQQALVAMKRSLARVAMLSNRWPASTDNIVPFSKGAGPNDSPDEFRRGLDHAFTMLWDHWETIETALVDRGILDHPIPLTKAENDAIPF